MIQSDHPAIVEAAARIVGDTTRQTEKAKALFEWVRDQISHSNDAQRDEVTCTATEVLTLKTGACYAKAHLLAALMRSQLIPCGFCYQTFEQDGVPQLLHGLNAIYLDETKTWIRLDPRGNTSGAASPASFNLKDEKARLAFPEMKFLDQYIHASPLQEVVAKLTQHHDRAQLWTDLPKAP